MKEVSIIIPAVKWEPYTEQCITTCAALFPESKIILVLDQDNPQRKSFGNLAVIQQSGLISKKRNTGVNAAKTEFIAFIDSDAYPHKDWLRKGLESLRNDNSIGMVGGPNISPPAEEHERKLVGMAIKSWLVAGKWNFYKSVNSSARNCDNLPSCNLILRKSLYDQLHGMNEQMEVGEDTDFCARMIAEGFCVYFDPKAIVYHYDRKIAAYLRQRIVRGAGVYMHIFGNSAQKKNPYTYLLLQPVLTLLYFLSFPLGLVWAPWLCIMAVVGGAYLMLISAESWKCSVRIKDIPTVAILILAGNILPGAGFLLKAFHLLPSLHFFYRNDQQ